MGLRDDLGFVSRGVFHDVQGSGTSTISLPLQVNLRQQKTLEVGLAAKAIEVAIHG